MASILHDLGIEPGALLVNMVSFVLLLWLMKRFMFAPVGAFIEQRKKQVHTMLDDAEHERTAASQERQQVAQQKAGIVQQAQEAAEGLQQAAQRDADETRRLARVQATEIERTAHAAVERERAEAAIGLRQELGVGAATICRHMLGQTLTEERHRALLEQFIADIEKMAANQQPPQ